MHKANASKHRRGSALRSVPPRLRDTTVHGAVHEDIIKDIHREATALSEKQVRVLFGYVVLNSQQVQENEKHFIGSAMAIVENPNVFPFIFPNPQLFVDKRSYL